MERAGVRKVLASGYGKYLLLPWWQPTWPGYHVDRTFVWSSLWLVCSAPASLHSEPPASPFLCSEKNLTLLTHCFPILLIPVYSSGSVLHINSHFHLLTTFSKSAQPVSIFPPVFQGHFSYFFEPNTLEYFNHPVSHREFLLLHIPFLYFLSDGETWTEDQLIIKQKTLEVGTRPHEGDGCEQNKHEGPYEYGRNFSNMSDFIQQSYVLIEEKSQMCNVCGKLFRRNAYLPQHKKIHMQEKPYKCHECGKAFGHSSNLSQHQRIHTEEKPYECDECGRAFRRSSHLIQHQVTHTGEMSYVCNEYGKAFGRSSSLLRHQRIHSREKPYECTECGKAFSQSSHLTEHQRVHTKERPYECSDCGKAYSRNYTLLNIRGSIQERLLMAVMSVGNLSVGVHSFSNITGFTLEKDPMSAVKVGRPLVATPTSFSTRRLTVE